MMRIAARFVLAVLMLCAGCGGGGGESEPEHKGVAAFPDVLEIARAELGDSAPLAAVRVTENQIVFDHIQIGRAIRVKYNPAGVFTGGEPLEGRLNAGATFLMSVVPLDAPAKLLAAIREREDDEVTGFDATLARGRDRALAWHAKASVGGAAKEYEADLNGTLRG